MPRRARSSCSVVIDPRPPVAVPDAFGVRAASLVTLPVLMNDHDPNEDVLSIDPASVTGLDPGFGAVSITDDGQRLTVKVAPGATGTATLLVRRDRRDLRGRPAVVARGGHAHRVDGRSAPAVVRRRRMPGALADARGRAGRHRHRPGYAGLGRPRRRPAAASVGAEHLGAGSVAATPAAKWSTSTAMTAVPARSSSS